MKNIELLEKNLIKHGFDFHYFETCSDAIEYILHMIPEGVSIGFGGSVSVKESGLLNALQQKKYNLFHRELRPDIPYDKIYKIMHNCDWFVTSTNALTETGELVNIDGRGNRVAAMIDGPSEVLVFCGVNKIVPDIMAGIERTRNVATPKNCIRLNKKTPCAVTGKCEHCNSPDTICKTTVIMHHPTTGSNVHIILVNQDLGY